MLNKKQTSLTIKIFALILAFSFVASLVPVLGTRFGGVRSGGSSPGTSASRGVQPARPASTETKVLSLLGQGDQSFTRQDYQQAILFYQQAAQLDDNSAVAHAKLGVAYVRAGDREKGRPELDRALALDAKQDEALFYRGQLAAEAGQDRQARADYQAYLKLQLNGIHAVEAREALEKIEN